MAGFPKSLKRLLTSLEKLPGLGPKSATRLAFYLLNAPKSFSEEIVDSLLEVKNKVKKCNNCFHVSEDEICEICSDGTRNQNQICVVERPVDVLSLENLGSYKGVYHVLGGALNPLEHVGPEELKISELINRIAAYAEGSSAPKEIILATNPTMEGEATALYIKKKLEQFGDKISLTRIGSGLPMGGDLEFADMATLDRAFSGRREW